MGLLTVDLNAVIANWRLLGRTVGSCVSAVIKADAYGLGANEVGSALYTEGCRDFFFATLKEAIDSRAYLSLDANCYVLHGVVTGEEHLFSRHKLIPVLSSITAIKVWVEWCWNFKNNNPSLPCVLKIDTGMTRLGLSAIELAEFCSSKGILSRINPVVLMSHLACSDDANHPQNITQLQSFNEAAAMLKKYFPQILLSIANSSGVFLGSDYHKDMVRTGAALYGLHPTKDMDSAIKPVVSLDLPIIRLRVINTKVGVGYGAEHVALEGQVLAVVAGGYADGLHRILGCNGTGYCRGVSVPVVGRISMDAIIFDVTKVPDILSWLTTDASCIPFSVEVINPILNISMLSQKNSSLGYEVLTSLSSGRYQRRYLLGGEERFV